MERMVRKLIDDGWREYPDGRRKYARCFFKRFDTPTRCRCNDDKAGMQVCCAVIEFQGRASYELDLCGELQDGTWIKLHQWVMPEDIAQGLAVIPRMLAAWEHIANIGSSGPDAAGGYADSAGCAPRPCPGTSDLKGE